MNFCIISPTSGLERYATLSKTHLVLAHIADANYESFYYNRRQAGDFLILDNAAHEKGAAIDKNILKASLSFYNPQVCVLPDTLNDGKKTLSSSLRFLDEMVDKYPETQWMFVPQGKDWGTSCFAALKDTRVGQHITWIGVTRYLTINWGLSRVNIAEWIKRFYPDMKLHALGMVEGSIEELNEVRDSGLFESLDSSVPVWRGWNGYGLNHYNQTRWKAEGRPCSFEDNTLCEIFQRCTEGEQERHDLILSNLHKCGINTEKETL